MEFKSKADLDKIIIQKQKERQEQFSKLREEYTLDENSQGILKLSDDELISKLQSRELKAFEVLRAFLAKTLEVTETINCVTDFIPGAKQWAEDLDKLPKVKGPLHGVPFVVKDDHDVEGMDTTLGYAKRLNNPKSQNAVLVQALLDLGAIPFAKTNVPQSLYAYASDNLIFGTTLNAKNPKLSPGGSSSGSGALVGADGAVFATGSDVGGSLRIPAHFHGLSSLRCTTNRLSGKGVEQCMPKLVGLIGVPGIIARNAKTTAMIYRELLKDNLQNSYDPLALPVSWNEQIFSSKSKLRIGYFTNLKFFPTIGDTSEIVTKAKDTLESLGHTLVPFEMPDDFKFMQLINTIVNADGGASLREMFQNEQISPAVKGLVSAVHTSEWKRRLASVTPWGQSSKRIQLLSQTALDARNSEELWDKMYERRLLVDEILQRMDKANVELLLSPSFPFPAIKVDNAAHLLWATVYTFIWNVVDFPAGVVNFGTESGKNIENYDDEGDSLLRLAKESTMESSGMPITVQFIARPFKEELVLRALTELEQAI